MTTKASALRALLVATLSLGSLQAAMVACSDPVGPTPQDASTDVVIPPPDASTIRDARADGFDVGTNSSASPVLINEISGPDEWIEFVNAAEAGIDLGGYRVADRDKDTGEPKVREAVTFPAGTTLQAGSYLIVKGGGLVPGTDAGKPCPDGGQSFCFHASFGVSNANGETIFMLFPDGGLAGKVVYPPNASGPGTSYARIPTADPSATFRTAPETPGAAN